MIPADFDTFCLSLRIKNGADELKRLCEVEDIMGQRKNVFLQHLQVEQVIDETLHKL